MAEKFLHLLDRMALIDQQTSGCMPQIVKADDRQFVRFQHLLESSAHKKPKTPHCILRP